MTPRALPAWAWVLLAAGGALLLYGLHRLALWAEARGWIYYRQARGGGAGAGILLDLDILMGKPKSQVELIRKLRENAREDQAREAPEGEDPAPPRYTGKP